MSLRDQILANAAAVDRLWGRIHETFSIRHRSKAHQEDWRKACEAFHHGHAELAFPGGMQRWQAFLNRDSSELDTAITVLEVDPRFFRSGYMKQAIWDRLKRAALSAQQERTLEAVAANYLQRPVRREFWHMVRYVRVRGSAGFWQYVESLASENAGSTSVRAQWLLLAKQNLPVRTWINRELRRARYESGYTPRLIFSSGHGQ